MRTERKAEKWCEVRWGEAKSAKLKRVKYVHIAKSVSRLIGLDLLLVSFSTHWHLNAVHSTRSTRYCVPGFSLLPQLNYYGIDCNLQRALLFILRAHDSFCASDSRLFVVCVCVLFLLLYFCHFHIVLFILSFHFIQKHSILCDRQRVRK